MKKNETGTVELKKLFSPQRFKLEHLLLFWCITILVPIATIFALLNYSFHEAKEADKSLKTTQLLDSLEILQRNCQPEAYFQHLINAAEKSAGLPQRHSAFELTDDAPSALLTERLSKEFFKLPGFSMILTISCEEDLKNLRVIMEEQKTRSFTRPGNRAASSVLVQLSKVLQTPGASHLIKQNLSEKMLKNFTESIFGSYFNPVAEDNDFSTGFIDRLGGLKLFTARRFIFDRRGKPLFGYLALFYETENLLKKSFNLAVKKAPAEFHYNLAMKKARPFHFVTETIDGQLQLIAPVSFSLLTSGQHVFQDLVSRLLTNGTISQKPAMFPHFIISTPLQTKLQNKSFKQISFSIYMALCLSLLLFKSFHQQEMLQFSIRSSLFLSVFLAIAMPASVFIFFAQRHAWQRLEMRKIELQNLMKNRLSILELAIKTRDEANTSRFNQLVNHLRENLKRPVPELQKILETAMDGTFFGISLFKNDGEVINKINLSSAKLNLIEDKISLHNDIVQGSMIKLMQELGLMQDKFMKKLAATASGKKLLAVAGVFEKIDIDVFCGYEGQAHTSRKDFGTFRFLNYKILPEVNSKEADAGVLLIVQDLRDVVQQIIMELSKDLQMFNAAINEGVIETTLVGTYDLDASQIDLARIWPQKSTIDKNEQDALQVIARGKSELVAEIFSDHAVPTIITAKRMGRYPLIAVSQCSLVEIARAGASIRIFVILIFAYFFVLTAILTTYLNEMFVMPITTLVEAAKLTGEGQQVVIDNNFSNELAQLTGEFSIMSAHVKERERLARFISREAEDTIARESKSLQTIASQKVKKTILFIHIKQFTELTQKLEANDLITLLNCYFPFFEQRIISMGGQIDKYISDAIMAIFSDHNEKSGAASACMATSRLLTDLPVLTQILTSKGLPAVEFGAGIATGEVISGRIGSYESRLDYTVIGDRVNLAARLEAMSHKAEKSNILVDSLTSNEAKKHCTFAHYGSMQVKGKSMPVEVYELIN